jgi:hypothetical protein
LTLKFRQVDLSSPQALPFRPDPDYLVFASSEALAAFYEVPPWSSGVDWAREFLLVAERGECPTGGYRLVIETVTRPSHPAADLVAKVVMVDPRPGDMVTMALTFPRAAVAVERAGLEGLRRVVFVDARGRTLRTAEVTD